MLRKWVWTIASLLLLSACAGQGDAPPYKPIADTKLLMASLIDPNADILWDAVGTIVDKDGTHNIRPQSDQDWEKVRNSAVAVTEAGNLLMMVPRTKDAEWTRLAQGLVDTGAHALKATQAKNADDLFDAGAEIYAVCSNCHAKYMQAITQAGGQ